MNEQLFKDDCENAQRYVRQAMQKLQRLTDHLPDKPSRQRTAIRKARDELATAYARLANLTL